MMGEMARPGFMAHDPAGGSRAADCLDAEALAAWVDGGLRPDEAASVEGHVASCSRCQDILATVARTLPFTPVQPWWRRGRTLGWLVPVTAGATAAVLWLAIPPNPRPGPPERQQVQTQAPAASADFARPADTPATPAPDQARFRARPDERLTGQREAKRQDAVANTSPAETREARNEAAESKQEASPPERLGAQRDASRAAASPPPAAAVSSGALASRLAGDPDIGILSPDPSIRWRIRGGTSVHFSTDGGATWEEVVTGVTVRLTAGASPSPRVCWLVGQRGTVLLTTDGRRWQRKTFPEAVDLNGILAKDARTATVTAVDGRLFSTADGGSTWTGP